MAGIWLNILEGRELVVMEPGGPNFLLGREDGAKVGRSGLFSREGLSEPGPWLLRNARDRSAKGLGPSLTDRASMRPLAMPSTL